MTNPNANPTLSLAAIIAAGVARYQASLPDYARGAVSDIEAPQPIITLSEERQAQICLSCPLVDCVGIENRNCPIRIEQRAEWRRKGRRR